MKILSVRRGYECDHSTRDYGCIAGMRVYYDYGTFDITFLIPYDTEVFRLLQKCKNIHVKKAFNKIEVNVLLWCEDFGEDEEEYVNLAHEIRKEIMKKNKEVIKILDLYHEEDEGFRSVEAKTGLGKKLQTVLSM